MFQLSSPARLPGDGPCSSVWGLHLTFATHGLLLFVALCVSSSSVAQNGNPLGSLLGKKNQAPATQTTPAPTAGPPAELQTPTAIPLPDVATRSEELTRLLREISDQLPMREQLDALKATLAERDASLQAKKKEVDALLAGSPGALELREQQTY